MDFYDTKFMMLTMFSGRKSFLSIVGIVSLLTLITVSGCGENLRLVPVSGTVTFDEQPLTSGNVSFVPDLQKGNKAEVAVFGIISPQGTYDLQTTSTGAAGGEPQPGAPLGWYRVVVQTEVPPGPDGKVPAEPPQKIPDEYKNAETTKLQVEVVENPATGAYDLKLKSTENKKRKIP